MRIRLKDGRWYETELAIEVMEKLRYTRRGNWVYHRYCDGEVIDEDEAVQLMISVRGAFEACPGFRKLPQRVRDQLEAYLDDECNPGDEV